MPRTGGFSVAWQKYSSVMCAGFSQLQQNSEFVDMTLAADGHFIRVHQMVIGLASPYLKELLRSSPTPHPILFLNNVSHKVLCCILEYMYTGEVIVPANLLQNFIEIGKSLCIRGIEDMQANATAEETEKNVLSESHEHEPYDTVEVANEGHESNIQTDGAQSISTHVYMKQEPSPAERNIPITLSSIGKRVKVLPLSKKLDMPVPAKKQKTFVQAIPTEDFLEESVQNEETITEEYIDDDVDLEPEDQPASHKTDVMFTVSNMGGLQMIVNRYLYRIRSIYKDGRRRWQCVDENKKCRAQAITKDDILLSRTSMHNHPFHDKRIMAKVNKNAVYANIEKADRTCAKEHVPQSD